jgi:hypothetical protein
MLRFHWSTAAILALAALPATADTILAGVSPSGIKEMGFSLRSSRARSGELRVDITREPSKAGYQGGHIGYLEISGDPKGRSVKSEKDGKVERYRFTLDPGTVDRARFSVSEYQTSPDEKVLGGGTLYRFELKEFFPEKARR